MAEIQVVNCNSQNLNETASAKKRKRKYVYANFPGVPGCTYYLTVSGKNRTLMCIGNEKGKVLLTDLSNGFAFAWDYRHFAYMVRQHRWKDTEQAQAVAKLEVKQEIEVQHEIKPEKEFSSREYGQKELDALVDNIEDIEF